MSDSTLTADQLTELRAHVVYTADGTLADSSKPDPQTLDEFHTTAADVQEIVTTHLDAFVRAQQAKMPRGKKGPVPVLIWAHGGLTTKAQGMATAHRQVSWWLDNGVFPIHAVWESGFWTTLEDVIGGKRAGERGISDLTDIAVEAVARLLGGRKFWDDMKVDASAASLGPTGGRAAGGAFVLAAALRDYVQKNPKSITLHAAGHSAGSIYHSAFVPLLFSGDDPVPSVKTVTFLAPAVRIDTFEQELLPLARSGGIEDLSIFTMNRDQEKRDNTAGVYRKSLLWLVSHAFEVEKEARILGLEEHLRTAGPTLSYLKQEDERLVLGPTSAGKRTSTLATSHGDFDNDAATMMSLARRVVGTNGADPDDDVSKPFGAESREAFPTPPPEPTVSRALEPRRRALCIGIDAYERQPLSGCVADAQTWEDALTTLEFDVVRLRDKDATRDAMLRSMLDLVTTSAAGDVVAIQFAGHGTTVPDLDGDEAASQDKNDEALCPVDFFAGQIVIDDDLGVIWDAIPDGVSVTLFFDSCHSGSANRNLGDSEILEMTTPLGATPRKIYLTDDERELFRAARGVPLDDPVRRAAREDVVASETGRAVDPPSRAVREILFSACQPDQVALETGGHGVFTTNATKVLLENPGASNQQFHVAVRDAMAELWEQRPAFEPGVGLADVPLLSPHLVADVLVTPPVPPVLPPIPETNGHRAPEELRTAAIVAILRATADLLEAGSE
ncbi:caspase domain-containing protein [Microbacterium sp. NPDC056044]|uniref:caspase family protein n=1 Tax=Microbacterium sp. NPDC056044 TaxID=3345690 RepID=UPI0035DDF2DF